MISNKNNKNKKKKTAKRRETCVYYLNRMDVWNRCLYPNENYQFKSINCMQSFISEYNQLFFTEYIAFCI